MDSDGFLTWLEKRLWPTFKKFREEKKIVLIVDNVPCHYGMEEGWKSPLDITKTDVPGKDGAFANAPKGPMVSEVRQATFKAAEEKRPEEILTHAERWFEKHDAGYMLFTPPYCPDFKPTELCWDDAKTTLQAPTQEIDMVVPCKRRLRPCVENGTEET